MNIGIVTSAIDQTAAGIGRYTFNLTKNLLSISKNNYTFIHFKKNKNELYQQADELIIPNLPMPNTLRSSVYLSLIDALKKVNLDIVHDPTNVGLIFPAHFKKIVTFHDHSAYLFPETHRYWQVIANRYISPHCYNNQDKIITVSKNTKEDVIRFLKIPEEKIIPIYEAAGKNFKLLNEDQIIKIKREYRHALPFILYVGTLEPRKNIPSLIKAFYKLRKRGLPYRLVITGKRGWKYKDIFDTIDELNLQKDVIFTGFVSDENLPALYNAADLFVYPSIYEGFGLPPLEAMACGTPVITSNTSSLPEIVGDAGIMVDPHNIDRMADAMYEVLTNKGLKADMIKKGLERSKIFSWEKCARETLKVYEDVYNEQ